MNNALFCSSGNNDQLLDSEDERERLENISQSEEELNLLKEGSATTSFCSAAVSSNERKNSQSFQQFGRVKIAAKGRKTSLRRFNTVIRRSKRLINTQKYSTRGSSNKCYSGVKRGTCYKRKQNTVDQKSNGPPYKKCSGEHKQASLPTCRELIQSIALPIKLKSVVQNMLKNTKRTNFEKNLIIDNNICEDDKKVQKTEVQQNTLENTEGKFFEINCDCGDEDDEDDGIFDNIHSNDFENCCALHKKYVPLLKNVQKLHPIEIIPDGEEISHTQANNCSKPESKPWYSGVKGRCHQRMQNSVTQESYRLRKKYGGNQCETQNTSYKIGAVLLENISLENIKEYNPVVQHDMLKKTEGTYLKKNLNSDNNINENDKKGDQSDVISDGIDLNNVGNNCDEHKLNLSSPFYGSIATSTIVECNNSPDSDLFDVMALEVIHGKGSISLKRFDQIYKQTFGSEEQYS